MRGLFLIVTFVASALLTAAAPLPEPHINYNSLVARTDRALEKLQEKHDTHHAAWKSWTKEYRHAQDMENTHRDHKEDALRKGSAYSESAKHHEREEKKWRKEKGLIDQKVDYHFNEKQKAAQAITEHRQSQSNRNGQGRSPRT